MTKIQDLLDKLRSTCQTLHVVADFRQKERFDRFREEIKTYNSEIGKH